MNQIKTKLFAAALLGLLFFSNLFGLKRMEATFLFSEEEETTEEKAEHKDMLNVPLVFYTAIPENFEKVNEAFCAMTERELGFSARLIAILSSSKDATITMLKNEGISFDVFSSVLGAPFTDNENLLPLDEWLKTDGQGILEILSEEELNSGKVDGQILRLPNKGDIAECSCVVMRKDLLEKYHVTRDASSLEELNEILSEIEPEEGMALIAPSRMTRSFLNRYYTWLRIGNAGLVIMDYGEAPTVEILYQTEEYRKMVSMFYEWNQKGWTPNQAFLMNFPSSDLVKNGELLGYFCHYKPGIDVQESMKCGYEMEAWILTDSFLDSTAQSPSTYSVSKDCKNKKQAVQLLNFMYTSEKAMNLLNYGIEGENYRINNAGNAVLIKGQEDQVYYSSLGWELPNQYLCAPWGKDRADVWEKTELFNKNARRPAALAFVFDSSAYEKEISAMREVIEEYSLGLETGI